MTILIDRLATYLILLCCFTLAIPTNTALATSEVLPPESAVIIDEVIDPELAVSSETQAQASTEVTDELDEMVVETNDDQLLVEDGDEDTASSLIGDDSDSGQVNDEVTPPSPSAQHPALVVTRLQLGDSDSGTHELIEIRNNSDQLLDVTNWRIYYTPANSNKQVAIVSFTPTDSAVGWRVTIDPGQYLVYATEEFMLANPGFVSSGIFNQTLAGSGGRLLIEDANQQLVSGMAWGAVDEMNYLEGPPIDLPDDGYLMARNIMTDGWHQNSRQNQIDFTNNYPIGGPYQAGLASDVLDACLNIDGISEVVPDSWYRDVVTGDCSDIPPDPPNDCRGFVISEIAANLDEQFVELYNSTDSAQMLDGCQLSSDHSSSKNYVFDSIVLEPASYYELKLDQTELQIYKTTSTMIYLVSEDGSREVDTVSYENLDKDTSWSLMDGQWLQTYTLTPGQPNQYAQYPPCETGYRRSHETGRCNKINLESDATDCAVDQFLNPDTGRCKLLAVINTLVPCKVGQYRSEETNRCRSLSSTSTLQPCQAGQYRNPTTNRCKSLTSSTSSLVPCDAGKFRNPATNRCKQVASTASTLKPCDPGEERNPATNRCRQSSSTAAIAGASFPVEPIADTGKAFVGWWALGGVLSLGLGYAGWEWRHEILNIIRRAKM